MSKDNDYERELGQRAIWFNVLLLLDAFVLGGQVTMGLVLQLLESTMERSIKIEAQQEILNVLDHLFPYRLGYIGISLLLGLTTVGAFVWLRIRTNAV